MRNENNNDLRPEYDLSNLRVRKIGPDRNSSEGFNIYLEPDVANFFSNSQAVNEALRFLIKITKSENKKSPLYATLKVAVSTLNPWGDDTQDQAQIS